MKIATFIVCMALISCFGCQTNEVKDSEMQSINEQFHTALNANSPGEDAKKYKAYLVIPNSGCSGCISSAEDMLKRGINQSNQVKYVLTKIESLKMLSYKMGFDVTKNEKIIIDKQNLFNSGPLKSIYPQILLISKEDGSVYRKIDISPKEDGLRILKEQYLIN